MSNPKRTKRLVLGEGEVVGHKHVLVSDSDIDYVEDQQGINFMLKNMGILTHDEHDRMVFEPGDYKSYNQVEFNPFDGTVNRVFD
jgi:hypothetical protein